jgi:hypothetical protein
MSKEFNNFEYTSNENRFERVPEPLTVPHEARLLAIKALKRGMEDENTSTEERIKRVDSLITLLNEEKTLSDVGSDIAKAEKYKILLLEKVV